MQTLKLNWTCLNIKPYLIIGFTFQSSNNTSIHENELNVAYQPWREQQFWFIINILQGPWFNLFWTFHIWLECITIHLFSFKPEVGETHQTSLLRLCVIFTQVPNVKKDYLLLVKMFPASHESIINGHSAKLGQIVYIQRLLKLNW